MHTESGPKLPIRYRCLSAILLASAQCTAPTAWGDSVGEEIGESARKISNGVTSVYQTAESAALNSAETVSAHAESLQRSVNELTDNISQDYQNFIYDFQKGYNK